MEVRCIVQCIPSHAWGVTGLPSVLADGRGEENGDRVEQRKYDSEGSAMARVGEYLYEVKTYLSKGRSGIVRHRPLWRTSSDCAYQVGGAKTCSETCKDIVCTAQCDSAHSVAGRESYIETAFCVQNLL